MIVERTLIYSLYTPWSIYFRMVLLIYEAVRASKQDEGLSEDSVEATSGA